MKFKCLFIMVLLVSSLKATGQVDDINEELEQEKKRKRVQNNYHNSNSSDESDLNLTNNLRGVKLNIGAAIVSLQTETLKTRKEHPEIVSLEGSFITGYYSQYNTVLYSPKLRGNWGLFSTEFRGQLLSDATGNLDTYDWQILKLNFPAHPLILSLGIGFTTIPVIKLTYFEYTVEGKLRLLKDRLVSEVNYRSTDKNNNSWFRREFRIAVDYEIKNYVVRNNTKFRICPMLGFNYQNYFRRVNQVFIIAGVNFRLF